MNKTYDILNNELNLDLMIIPWDNVYELLKDNYSEEETRNAMYELGYQYHMSTQKYIDLDYYMEYIERGRY